METRFGASSPVSTSDKMRPLTIIECEICRSPGFSCVDYAEAEALMCQGSVSHYCCVCKKDTMWRQLDMPLLQASLNVA